MPFSWCGFFPQHCVFQSRHRQYKGIPKNFSATHKLRVKIARATKENQMRTLNDRGRKKKMTKRDSQRHIDQWRNTTENVKALHRLSRAKEALMLKRQTERARKRKRKRGNERNGSLQVQRIWPVLLGGFLLSHSHCLFLFCSFSLLQWRYCNRHTLTEQTAAWLARRMASQCNCCHWLLARWHT